MTLLVGLDLSLRCTGYAYADSGSGVTVGRIKPPTKMRGVERLLWIEGALLSALPNMPSVVVIEDYAMGAKGRVFHIGEWGGVARLALYRRGNCATHTASPSTIKQAVTGNGNAKKDRMLREVRTLFPGLMITDDNEADALAALVVAGAMTNADFLPPSAIPRDAMKLETLFTPSPRRRVRV